MARTKIPAEFSSTPGIVDNSSATAITIDSAGAATFSGNVGIGTSSPFFTAAGRTSLSVNGTSSSILAFGKNDSSENYILADAGGFTIGNTSATLPTLFYNNGEERMRIDTSGFVGIGTSSPSSKLDINISTNARGYFADNIGEVTSGTFCLQVVNSANTALKPLGFRAEDIRFATGSAERMRIDTSGNVGIGKAVNPVVRLSVGSPESTASSYGLEVCNASYNTRFLVDGLGTTTFYKSDNAEIARIGEYNNSCNLLIGATAPTHVISSDSARNKLYIEGLYPSISIIGGTDSNANHGPTLQFGNQLANDLHWVIGSGNTSAQLDIGWGTPANKNPHNGIAGYSGGGGGATMMRITSTGVGVGGNWGYYGTIANPAYPLHVQGTASATQYNRGAVEMGRIIIHEHQLAATNHSLSGSTTAWTDTGLTKTITPQSAKSYFWVEMYHNEHINPNTPNYGGGLRLMGGSTEISRGGAMEYQSGTWASGADYRYNGDAKTWGGWYNPATASAIVFKAQAAAPNSQAGNYYYWHWQSNYIANQTGPRLRIIEFT